MESGSNSDGEWTRWADGTQQCFINSIEFTYGNGSFLVADWDYPIQFTSEPVVVCPLLDSRLGGNITVSENSGSRYIIQFRGMGAVDSQIRIIDDSTAFTSGDTYYSRASATGRWK